MKITGFSLITGQGQKSAKIFELEKPYELAYTIFIIINQINNKSNFPVIFLRVIDYSAKYSAQHPQISHKWHEKSP